MSSQPSQAAPQSEAIQQGSFQRPPAQGKVYAVTQEKAENSKTVISELLRNILPVHPSCLGLLFDSCKEIRETEQHAENDSFATDTLYIKISALPSRTDFI